MDLRLSDLPAAYCPLPTGDWRPIVSDPITNDESDSCGMFVDRHTGYGFGIVIGTANATPAQIRRLQKLSKVCDAGSIPSIDSVTVEDLLMLFQRAKASNAKRV